MTLANKKVLVEDHIRHQPEPTSHADLFSVEDL
jgi:hypothetical protein